MQTLGFRILYFVLAAAVVLLALMPPGPLAGFVESGEDRHIMAFATLPLISAIGWPRIALKVQYIVYLVLGAAIEWAQDAMGAGRAAEWNDWAVDAAAAAIVLVFVGFVRTGERNRAPATA